MESVKELPLFSKLSTISIKNYHDKILVDLQPQLHKILETANPVASSYIMPSSAVEIASQIHQSSSVVHLTSSRASLKTSGRALIVKEPPLEIVIEHPLDEKSLVNLSRLLGEHTPTSLSQEEAASLIALLGKNQVEHLKIKSTGVRFVFRILEQTFRPLYRLPPQFEHFTGRTEELAALREGSDTVKVIAPRENNSVEEKDNKSISQISGTGGIGKSQLANYHARSQFRDKKYDWVIWMTGGEDDRSAQNNLRSQFADLGVALGLDVKQLEDEDLYRLIYQRLALKGRGLVVIDDAPNYAVAKSFLPENFGHPEMDVLITTRNSHTFDTVITKILLDVFTLQDAKQYIHRLLKEMTTDTDAEMLATTLDRYPLALTQALAYILNNQCTVSEYCHRYSKLRAAQQKYLETPVLEDDPYQLEHTKRKRQFEATMKVVVQLSLEQVRAICQTEEVFERAKRVLLATSYLAPEAAIPKGLLGKWLPNDEAEAQINEVLDAIRALSLLEEGTEVATYRIHQVVQDTLRLEETSQDSQNKLLQWRKIIMRYLEASGVIYIEREEEKHRVLEPHMIVLGQYLSRQPRIDKVLKAECDISVSLGYTSAIQRKEKNSLPYYENALNCQRQLSKSDKPNGAIGQCIMNIGLSHLYSGDPKSAMDCMKEALPILKINFGEEDAVVGECLLNLGLATLEWGNAKDAIIHFERALPILKATKGEQHYNVGKCLVNLGNAKLENGDPKAAKEFLVTALSILKSAVGERHPDVGLCILNLGLAELECGDPRSGQKNFEIALSILVDVLGEDHRDVGKCLVNYAVAALACGATENAKRYSERALPILKKTLGERHAFVGKCLMNLGAAILSSSAPQGAKAYLEDALSIMKETLGERHFSIGQCLLNLGSVSMSCNDMATAKKYYELALSVLKETLGDQHPNVGVCQMNVAITALENDPQVAILYLVAALKTFRAAGWGDERGEVGKCWLNLGRAYISSVDLDNAQRCLKIALPILKGCYGEEDATVLFCQYLLDKVVQSVTRNPYPNANSTLFNREYDLGREIRRSAGEGTLQELEQLLLANNLNFANEADRKSGVGRTPLHWAVINNRPEHVGLLLAYIGYTNLKDAKGCSALEYAVQGGNAVIIDHFKTALMNHYAVHQEALLPLLVCRCVEAGDEAGLKLLIYLKVSVDYGDEKTGQTALHVAVRKGNESLIKLLVEAGADPFREDFKGATPLMLAEEKDESLALIVLQIVGQEKTL